MSPDENCQKGYCQLTVQPGSNGFSMGLQTFNIGQSNDIIGFFPERTLGIVDQAGLLDKVVHG